MTAAGTVMFMDPHVFVFEDDEPETQHAEYGVKADIWSLGVTLCVVMSRLPSENKVPRALCKCSYTILSEGAYPLKSKKAIKSLARDDDASRAWQMPPFDAGLEIPADIAAFVQLCLTPNQEARPDTRALLQ